jgi:Type I phosphodiesterase / nucleotide pyrophosphatase
VLARRDLRIVIWQAVAKSYGEHLLVALTNALSLLGVVTFGTVTGSTTEPVLSNALDFVDQSLGKMVFALAQRGLLNRTTIIVSAKRGQSPMNPAALNRIKGRQNHRRSQRWVEWHPSKRETIGSLGGR